MTVVNVDGDFPVAQTLRVLGTLLFRPRSGRVMLEANQWSVEELGTWFAAPIDPGRIDHYAPAVALDLLGEGSEGAALLDQVIDNADALALKLRAILIADQELPRAEPLGYDQGEVGDCAASAVFVELGGDFAGHVLAIAFRAHHDLHLIATPVVEECPGQFRRDAHREAGFGDYSPAEQEIGQMETARGNVVTMQMSVLLADHVSDWFGRVNDLFHLVASSLSVVA